jgi:hypothetical protein
MKQPIKYNWFFLFILTFLAVAVFFVAMTGWRIGRTNDSPGRDSAMAGQAMAPDREKSPVGTGDFTSDGPAGVRSGKPGTEELKPADPDSLAVLADACAEYWSDLSGAERDAGYDTTRPFAGIHVHRPGEKLTSYGGEESDSSTAAGSKGKEGYKLVPSPGKYRVRVAEMTDDRAGSH